MYVSSGDRESWDSAGRAVAVDAVTGAVTVHSSSRVDMEVDGELLAAVLPDRVEISSPFYVDPSGTFAPPAFDVTGTSVVTRRTLVVSAGGSVPSGAALTCAGSLATPVAATAPAVVNRVLVAPPNVALVNLFSVAATGAVEVDAIDAGAAADGQRLSVGLFGLSQAALLVPVSLTVRAGLDGSGGVTIDTSRADARPIVTMTGSDVSISMCGVLHFIFVAGFGGLDGAWIQC